MKERISVLVPIYNVGEYLHQCLDSLLRQTYKDFEVILVNDGSTDNSKEICQEYIQKDSRFLYFEKENSGIADTRNYCIEKSTGAYLTFIDPDDWVEDDYLEFLYTKLSENQSDLVITSYYTLNEAEGMFYFYIGEHDYYEQHYSSLQLIEDLYEQNHLKHLCFATSTGKLFKRGLFDNLSFPDGRVGEDGLTMLKVYLKTDKILYINIAKYAYRRRVGSLSNTWSPQWLRDIVYAMEERLALLSTLGYPLDVHIEAYRSIMQDVVGKNRDSNLAQSPEFKHIFENNLLINQFVNSRTENETKQAIVLAANYGYATQVETTIKSICYHNRNVHFYLINADFPNEWFLSLNKKLAPLGSSIENCRVTADQIQQYKTDISYTVFLRYFVSDFVTEDRVIYMDCDMVVTGNLSELFTMDMKGHPIAAVQDQGGRVYYNRYMFNAGFLLIDNAYWKRENMSQQLIDLTNEWHDKVDQADQSILNMRFENNWLELPFDYNHIVLHDHFVENPLPENQAYPTVIHYLTHRKPWKDIADQPFRDVWWFYHDLEWSEVRSNLSLKNLETSDLYPKDRPFTCLIFTNSEIVERLELLIQSFPDYHFNIASRVVMTDGLTRLIRYPNVTLYSGIVDQQVGLENELKKTSDVLLDINYGPKTVEILDWFENQKKPIYAFNSTKTTDHNQIIAKDVSEMLEYLKNKKGN